MQAVCDTLEQLVQEGVLKQYAIGGATAAGFHGEPLATRDIDVFVFSYGLTQRWQEWANALGLSPENP